MSKDDAKVENSAANPAHEKIESGKRRAFIKRLAKAGAIAPVAIILHDASVNVASAE